MVSFDLTEGLQVGLPCKKYSETLVDTQNRSLNVHARQRLKISDLEEEWKEIQYVNRRCVNFMRYIDRRSMHVQFTYY